MPNSHLDRETQTHSCPTCSDRRQVPVNIGLDKYLQPTFARAKRPLQPCQASHGVRHRIDEKLVQLYTVDDLTSHDEEDDPLQNTNCTARTFYPLTVD